MKTLVNNGHPTHHVKLYKVQGRTFFLMLPLEKTLKKICPDTDPLNADTNLFITVRSVRTKKKQNHLGRFSRY